MFEEKICVLGLGYIGLPTAVILASAGYCVVGYDVNQEHLRKLNSGQLPFFEAGLEKKFAKVCGNKKLQISGTIRPADVFIICVPTPIILSDTDPSPDIEYVFAAGDAISEVVAHGDLIIIESTCPVGTTKALKDYLATKVNFIDKIDFACCPERVLPGNILHELVHNDRVIGGLTVSSAERASRLYQSYTKGQIFSCTAVEAELCKLAENSYRDVNIAFANELSRICDSVNVDPLNLIKIANRHPRVNILRPGPGVGGHCIPVDPWFLVSGFPNDTDLIKMARAVNSNKTNWVVRKIIDTARNLRAEKDSEITTALLGLSYKENLSDIRGAPGLQILDDLKACDENVIAVEPHLTSCNGVGLIKVDDAVRIADLVVILVAHDEFQGFKDLIKKREVLDFCGFLN